MKLIICIVILIGFVSSQSANLQILEEVGTPLAMAVSQTHSDTKIVTNGADTTGNTVGLSVSSNNFRPRRISPSDISFPWLSVSS